ncbi:hypothetical protein W97_02595 [Coniosporium apollinis CBS 100218]|uniref:Uncharacterized protein n=1 Tax=Coniosporium apollinis (strain CBS 100218) TaxID=1168221 RepID=R7YNC1_CONA1|nr:uncharacterized protein W97_02595 [Coniosporium apollinis CBS 100218]EON63368.1 hypothetical protein W97_02595 [Coniosporium apollinis CBS 100218]
MKKYFGIGGGRKEKKGTHEIDRRREETKREEERREEAKREGNGREESRREEKANEGFDGADALDVAEEFRDHERERKPEGHEVEGPATSSHHFDRNTNHSGDVVSSKTPQPAGDTVIHIVEPKNTTWFPVELLSADGTSNYLRNITNRMHETTVQFAYVINKPAPKWRITDFKDKPWMVPGIIHGQKEAISGIMNGLKQVMAAEGIQPSMNGVGSEKKNLIVTFGENNYKNQGKLVDALGGIYLDQGAVAMYNRLEAISFSDTKSVQSQYLNQWRIWKLCDRVMDNFISEHMEATEPPSNPGHLHIPSQPFRSESKYDSSNPFTSRDRETI